VRSVQGNFLRFSLNDARENVINVTDTDLLLSLLLVFYPTNFDVAREDLRVEQT
jgi:hypothetical protein